MTEPTDPTEFSAEAEAPLTAEAEAALTQALRCAYRPAELDPDVLEALIELALEDPLRPASEAELAESERFRQALEGQGEHPDLDLVRGLMAAHRSSGAEPGGIAHMSDRALDRALAGPNSVADADPTPRSKLSPASKRTRGNVIFVSFGVMTALAAAAAVILVVFFPSQDRALSAAAPAFVPAPAPLTQSRSSETLFDAKFERDHTTERVDRIASVRARELRQNRFRQWGVPTP